MQLKPSSIYLEEDVMLSFPEDGRFDLGQRLLYRVHGNSKQGRSPAVYTTNLLSRVTFPGRFWIEYMWIISNVYIKILDSSVSLILSEVAAKIGSLQVILFCWIPSTLRLEMIVEVCLIKIKFCR